jgi:hypothetical protein
MRPDDKSRWRSLGLLPESEYLAVVRPQIYPKVSKGSRQIESYELSYRTMLEPSKSPSPAQLVQQPCLRRFAVDILILMSLKLHQTFEVHALRRFKTKPQHSRSRPQHAGGSDPMGRAGRRFAAADAVPPQKKEIAGAVCGRARVDGWFGNATRFVEGYSPKPLRGNMAGNQ